MLGGYAINGGGFKNYMSALRSKGWMEGIRANLRITAAGVDALGHFDPLPTGEALIEHWKNQLEKASRAILSTLVDNRPSSLTKEDVVGELKASDNLFPNAA